MIQARTLLPMAVGLMLVSFMISASSGKDLQVDSKWIPGAIKLDGLREDWPGGSMSTINDKGASLGVCNDSQNVYVMLCFRNPEWARVIKRTGLTFWIDPQGKKKKQFSLKFVGGPSWQELRKSAGKEPDRPEGQTPPGGEDRMKEMRVDDTAFTCFQKDYLVEKPIPLNGTEGPAAAFAIDQGFFVYEFSVPLKESSVLYYGLGVHPGQTLGVGLIWGEVDREAMRGKGGDGDERGGMGEGGGMGGGMPGGMPGGMGGGMGHERGGMGPGGGRGGFKMPEKQEVWLKSVLAAPGAPTESEKK